MWELVRNPDDRFSCVVAHMSMKISPYSFTLETESYSSFFSTVPKVRPYDVQMISIGANVANVSWGWDVAWLEEAGQIKEIQGKFRGFRVGVMFRIW